MRKVLMTAAAASAMLALAGCGGGAKGGVFSRSGGGPDEFAVSRQAPLVIPPDFALTPPRPGAPRPQEADSSTQALQAMFGGAAAAQRRRDGPRSTGRRRPRRRRHPLERRRSRHDRRRQGIGDARHHRRPDRQRPGRDRLHAAIAGVTRRQASEQVEPLGGGRIRADAARHERLRAWRSAPSSSAAC